MVVVKYKICEGRIQCPCQTELLAVHFLSFPNRSTNTTDLQPSTACIEMNSFMNHKHFLVIEFSVPIDFESV